MDLADLQRLVDAFEASDWNEIHLAVDGVEVHLSATGGLPPAAPSPSALRIAAGQPLSITQDEVRLTGHAIECRLNAEGAAAGFLPTPGRIERWTMPEGAGVRVDTHCFDGWTVVPHYDSMIAKLICWGGDRPEALRRMDRALAHVAVEGVSTTAGIARDLVRHGDFRANRINTRWVEDRFLPQWRTNRGEDHGVQVG